MMGLPPEFLLALIAAGHAGHTVLPRREMMKATQQLHDLGQSLWLDNITRDLLTSGTLRRYINEFSVTGLTSNPTIFDHAIKNSSAYDDAIREKLRKASRARRCSSTWRSKTSPSAADLFRPVHDAPTAWTAGFRSKSRPCWPTTLTSTHGRGQGLHARAARPNLFIKIPGTREALPAIEEAIFAGVPSTSLCCSLASNTWRRPRPTSAASSADRRRLNPDVASVASCSSAAGTWP